MIFAFPWAFCLLILIPLLLWVRGGSAGGRRRASIRFSWTRNAAQAGRSWRQRLAILPLLLRVVALVLLVVALARPQKGLEQVRDVNEGIAIEMVVDRSGSMRDQMVYQNERSNRLEVVKKIFEEFVLGNGEDLEGRPNDLIGLISFAGYAETNCALTLAHGMLPRFIERVQLAMTREEAGTAIGDAIALAAARLERAEETTSRQASGEDGIDEDYEIKSKIMILLTDGRQEGGGRSPLEGAALARDWGIKVYTIAVTGESIQQRHSLFGPLLSRGVGGAADTRTLRQVAEMTGGKFYEAQDAEALRRVYQEIDELERSEIQSLRYMDYKELFVPFALWAFGLIVWEVILNCTLFRKIP